MERRIVFEAKIKRWGNSWGVTLPKAKCEAVGLDIGDNININLDQKNDITDLWGTLPDLDFDGFMRMKEEEKQLEHEKDEEFLRQFNNHRNSNR